MTEAEVADVLKKAGFTGVQVQRTPLPPHLMGLFEPGELTGPNPAEDAGREMNYLRIVSDQGEFGLWTEPYFTLDLNGTGLSCDDFVGDQDESEGLDLDAEPPPPEMREIIGVRNEDELRIVQQKLVQRKTKP